MTITKIKLPVLQAMLAFASTDETRYVLNGVLIAQCYACVGSAQIRGSSREEWLADMFNGFNGSLLQWPFEEDAYTPAADARTNLVKAAALIVAEIERLHRAAGVSLPTP